MNTVTNEMKILIREAVTRWTVHQIGPLPRFCHFTTLHFALAVASVYGTPSEEVLRYSDDSTQNMENRLAQTFGIERNYDKPNHWVADMSVFQ